MAAGVDPLKSPSADDAVRDVAAAPASDEDLGADPRRAVERDHPAIGCLSGRLDGSHEACRTGADHRNSGFLHP